MADRARRAHLEPADLRALRRLRDALGLPGELTCHSLRHSYVTHLIEDGFDELFVRMQVGHRFASTTALYTGVSGDYKNQAMRSALRAQLGGTLRLEAT